MCLIAARGGSKRLPGKNTMLLGGKPLIAHSVEQARASGVCDVIAVSSDDKAILKASAADWLIERPPELATDDASSLDVILHAIKSTGKKYDTIIYLQATSPLRLPEDIIKAVQIFEEKPVSNLVSVVKTKDLGVNSSSLGKDKYDLNGSIYVWDAAKFIAEPKIIYPDTVQMEMPRLRSVDIDYESDFKLAEILIKGEEYKLGESAVAK